MVHPTYYVNIVAQPVAGGRPAADYCLYAMLLSGTINYGIIDDLNSFEENPVPVDDTYCPIARIRSDFADHIDIIHPLIHREFFFNTLQSGIKTFTIQISMIFSYHPTPIAVILCISLFKKRFPSHDLQCRFAP